MKLCLCGLGRAGREFVRYLAEKPVHELAAVVCRSVSQTAGKRVCDLTDVNIQPELIVQSLDQFDPKKDEIDVIIDFSSCETSCQLVDLCCRSGTNIVICPTDFTEEQMENLRLKAIRAGIGLVFASTLTSGINLVLDFVERLSRVFPEYHFEIIERHPLNKPSPTRTARYIQKAIARDSVPISSIRLDGYVGVHEITATDGFERISITHESFSRTAFVRGALLAAEFIRKKSGVYYMTDIVRALLLDDKL